MNRRQKIIVSVVGIFIVLLALVGLTYAYFLTKITGNTNDKSITVTTANLSVVYQDGNNQVLTKENIIPNTIVGEKEFSVVNDGTAPTTYSIILDNIENGFERNQDLVYTLTKEGETNPVATGNIASGSHQIIIPKVDIALNATDTYTFKLEYIEAGVDQSKDMNSTVSFRINIDNEATTWDNSEPTWLKEGEQTLINAIKSTSTYVAPEMLGVTANTSIPGVRESLEEERIISSIEDDYGTSYYYRGNIENNYVNYSGMCWRIVRIQGDGTIKLALADEDYECNESGALADGLTAYIDTYDSEGLLKYQFRYTNSNHASNSVNILDYEEISCTKDEEGFQITCSRRYFVNGIFDAVYNYSNETNQLRQVLHAWLSSGSVVENSKTISFDVSINTDNLVDTNFCNNLAITRIDDEKSPMYAYFDSYERLSNEDENLRIPKLKCNTKGLAETKSNRVSSMVGTLTADEIVLAGSVVHDFGTSTTSYLTDNSSAILGSTWTMTPARHKSNSAMMGVADEFSSGKIGLIMSVETYQSRTIRPVIVLKSEVILDSNVSIQNGTANNPFVIK